MNERIRELLEQAEKHVYEMWVKEGTPLYPESHDLFIQQKDETFAELIVRECAELIDNKVMITAAQTYDEICVTRYDTKELCAKQIKEHFGVE